jgi:hypothetical protein
MQRALLLAAALATAGARDVQTYTFNDVYPYTALDFFTVPFVVTEGIVEVEVSRRQTGAAENILDFGVADTSGALVGWSGGNLEPAIVGTTATSRSYMLQNGSTLAAGTWYVVLGKARDSAPPGSYSINVTLRDAPTLAPQPHRRAYEPSPPLATGLQWYAGDFHVHSCESGDAFANATVDEIASFAASQGLSFVHFSEHNTVSSSTFLNDAQTRHPNILLLPGVEYTTYYGHAGAILTTQYVDHRINNANVTIQGAVDAIHAQGGLFSINHLDVFEEGNDLRNTCVGCSWDYGGTLPLSSVDAMEVGVQSWEGLGFIFSAQALETWDHFHALGHTNVACIGGSDDHHGGQAESRVGNWETGSPIGSPTTLVLAANLSHAAIREGLMLGRTAIKMWSALDPSADLTAVLVNAQQPSQPVGAEVRVGGTVTLPSTSRHLRSTAGGGAFAVNLTATVSLPSSNRVTDSARRSQALRAGRDLEAASSVTSYVLQLVRNNEVTFVANMTSDPFTFAVTVPLPEGGTDRWRAEVHDAATGALHTLTNHIFLPSSS